MKTAILSFSVLGLIFSLSSARADCPQISGTYRFDPSLCKMTGAGKDYDVVSQPIPVHFVANPADAYGKGMLENSEFTIEQNDCKDFKTTYTNSDGIKGLSVKATDPMIGDLAFKVRSNSSSIHGSFGYMGHLSFIPVAYRDTFKVKKNEDGSLQFKYVEFNDDALLIMNVTTLSCTFPKVK